MGTCNCTENKSEFEHLKLEPTNIRLLVNTSYSELDDLKGIPGWAECRIQGLIRGYLVRRSFVSPTIPLALSALYKSLPEFNLGSVPEFSCRYLNGVYVGEISYTQLPEGKGRLYQPDSITEGTWVKGELEGTGRFLSLSNEVYTGSFTKNLRDGYGELVTPESQYKGEWKSNLKHGKGEEIFKNDSKYQGDYYKDFRHGKGFFLWPDGSSYEGDFRNNTIEGFGTYVWKGGRVYKGQWKNNKMHGRGKFTWEDGRVYEGEYFNNEKHGFGILCTSNGKKYEGKWANGKQHGSGVLYKGDLVKKGLWNNGKYYG